MKNATSYLLEQVMDHYPITTIWPSNLQDNLKTDIFGPPCCPVPPGEIMERSDTLESQPGLAGNDENVSTVFSSCWKC